MSSTSGEASQNSSEEQSPHAARVLLLIPDADLADLLDLALRAEGFVVAVGESADAATQYGSDSVDVAVVDSVVGQRAGSALIGELRRQGRLPVIVLTQSGGETWIRGDADTEFMSKPFSHRDLIARIRARHSPARGAI